MAANPHLVNRPIDLLLGQLDRIKQTSPDTWLASCPTANHKHGDRSRGLSIREGDDGRALVHCHAGCAVHEVVADWDWSFPTCSLNVGSTTRTMPPRAASSAGVVASESRGATCSRLSSVT